MFGKLRVLLCERGDGPIGEPEHVVDHEHLTVALGTSANTDCWHFQTSRYARSQIRGNGFENNRKHAGLLEKIGLLQKALCGLGVATLGTKSAQLMDRLRRQAKMSHNRNADIDQPLCRIPDLASAAFDLHGRRPALLNQPAGISHGFFHVELEGKKRHVSHDEGPFRASANGSRVMDHHVERHGKCVVKTQDNHPDGIANQNDVDTSAVQQPSHGVVVCGQYGDLLAAFFHRPEIRHAYRFHRLLEYTCVVGRDKPVMHLTPHDVGR